MGNSKGDNDAETGVDSGSLSAVLSVPNFILKERILAGGYQDTGEEAIVLCLSAIRESLKTTRPRGNQELTFMTASFLKL